ncbi:class A beta-lactamase-related serine hydrolase [Streptomyces sp. NBC_01210]|uniref:serine hydrolase n=1 Tax=Streptomyces sp. NBC_01210 TaxID=2903774 RepID=UPI002E15919C|nr:class A beta-lactamase-related serine hydrolase [Streptomyces sp. NBC_01210]
MTLSKIAPKVTLGLFVVAVSASAVAPVSTATVSHEPRNIKPSHGARSIKSAQEARSIKFTSKRLKGGLIECASENPGLAAFLTRDIAKSLKNRASKASVVLYDRTTHTSCTYGADKHYDSASIVKPMILGALLLDRGVHLSKEKQDLARQMIVSSDNDATYTLWDIVGPKNIQNFLDKAGMKNTVLDEAGFMGLTQVTARDQAKLLELLTAKDSSVLNAEERSYILGLMRDVQKDQRWGTPAAAPSDAAVQVKNGWLQRSETGLKNPWDRGDWKVNSMSAITGRAYDYGLVVLTENNRVPEGESPEVGWDYGMDTVEGVAKAIHHDLYPDHTPPATGNPSL